MTVDCCRYDMDHDDDVLYCYEIQLEESVRRKGLGKFMMKVQQTSKEQKIPDCMINLRCWS